MTAVAPAHPIAPQSSLGFWHLSVGLWGISVLCIGAVAWLAYSGGIPSVPLIGPVWEKGQLLDKLPPVAILALFVLIVLELFIRSRWVSRHRQAADALEQILQREESADTPQARQQLAAELERFCVQEGSRRAASQRVIARASAMATWLRRDPGHLHEALPAISSLDHGRLAGSYSPLGVYAWILPVLGFIGTAYGMAHAIGDFKEALGKAADFDALVHQLQEGVIPGLAGAFATTILALFSALVAYLCTTALRNRDQEALDHLDASSVMLLSRLPRSEVATARASLLVLDQIRAHMEDLKSLPREFGELSSALRSSMAAISLHMEEGLSVLAKEVESGLATISGHTKEASAKLDAMGTLKQSADAIATSAGVLERAGIAIQGASSELTGTSGELRAASSRLRQTVNRPLEFKVMMPTQEIDGESSP